MEDKIEILPNGTLQVRKVIVLENQTKIYKRYVLLPDTDITTIEDTEVKNIALTTWNDEVIQAYKDSLKTDL